MCGEKEYRHVGNELSAQKMDKVKCGHGSCVFESKMCDHNKCQVCEVCQVVSLRL